MKIKKFILFYLRNNTVYLRISRNVKVLQLFAIVHKMKRLQNPWPSTSPGEHRGWERKGGWNLCASLATLAWSWPTNKNPGQPYFCRHLFVYTQLSVSLSPFCLYVPHSLFTSPFLSKYVLRCRMAVLGVSQV